MISDHLETLAKKCGVPITTTTAAEMHQIAVFVTMKVTIPKISTSNDVGTSAKFM